MSHLLVCIILNYNLFVLDNLIEYSIRPNIIDKVADKRPIEALQTNLNIFGQ